MAFLSAMSAFWDQWHESTIEAIILAVALIIEDYYIRYYARTVRNESVFYGERWLCRLLEQGHVSRIHENLRMDRDTFLKLSKWLQDRRGLRNSRRISARQKLAIFLMITGQGMSQSGAVEHFQHSLQIILGEVKPLRSNLY